MPDPTPYEPKLDDIVTVHRDDEIEPFLGIITGIDMLAQPPYTVTTVPDGHRTRAYARQLKLISPATDHA